MQLNNLLVSKIRTEMFYCKIFFSPRSFHSYQIFVICNTVHSLLSIDDAGEVQNQNINVLIKMSL